MDRGRRRPDAGPFETTYVCVNGIRSADLKILDIEEVAKFVTLTSYFRPLLTITLNEVKLTFECYKRLTLLVSRHFDFIS
ncbi:hypothetical protein G5I_13905 [Acromyrmex echinatior]|uniref:Uncharacterized protein n=1 Tax=Acromyrmex echinatior TaxID=103372 RepID=F4X6A1_ACREC|nr:hypothetical protein G5I_13905 [Acromyrmex echinatior]